MLVKWSCWTRFVFFRWSNILFPSISIYFHIFGPKIPSSVSWISIFHGKSPFLLVNNKLFHGKSAIFSIISYESIIFSMVFPVISHESIIFSMFFPWISHVSRSTLYRPPNAVHAVLVDRPVRFRECATGPDATKDGAHITPAPVLRVFRGNLRVKYRSYEWEKNLSISVYICI